MRRCFLGLSVLCAVTTSAMAAAQDLSRGADGRGEAEATGREPPWQELRRVEAELARASDDAAEITTLVGVVLTAVGVGLLIGGFSSLFIDFDHWEAGFNMIGAGSAVGGLGLVFFGIAIGLWVDLGATRGRLEHRRDDLREQSRRSARIGVSSIPGGVLASISLL